jgi:preprotein translocase subunit SecA
LRAKGIDDAQQSALTYSGPSEDGSAEVQRRDGDGSQRTPVGVPAGASRRERREAARRQGRGAKPPKSVKRR